MSDRRRAPRYAFGIEGTIHSGGGGAGTKMTVRTLSATGCEIEGANAVNIGKKCELYFEWRDVVIGLQAQIAWRNAQGRMGLKFIAVDRDTQRRVNEVCAALRSQPARAEKKEEARPSLSPLTFHKPGENHGGPTGERVRRQFPRYVSELPALLSNPATGSTANVMLVSLSLKGGCIEGQGLPEAGQQCDINAEWEGRSLQFRSDIVWRTKKQAGVRFETLDDGTEQALKQICANLRMEPPPLIFSN